mmetsp:Transcript_4729/g.11104  ORF Transcript_4729/g.11104 Transcript_4729/m.11104 type:complete len:125 (-) Transcript_4729:80-454(-)
MSYATAALTYQVRFLCPLTLADGEHCLLTESLFGGRFPSKEEAASGPMVWHMIQHDGGRKFVRNSWLIPPWAEPTEYLGTHSHFHSYTLLRLVDSNGNLDEEHFQHLMRKLDGQDVIVPRIEKA